MRQVAVGIMAARRMGLLMGGSSTSAFGTGTQMFAENNALHLVIVTARLRKIGTFSCGSTFAQKCFPVPTAMTSLSFLRRLCCVRYTLPPKLSGLSAGAALALQSMNGEQSA